MIIEVDKGELKESGNWIELHNGRIGTFVESASGEIIKMGCSFPRLIAQNITAARQGETGVQFIKDARRLAAMLAKAAAKIEDEL